MKIKHIISILLIISLDQFVKNIMINKNITIINNFLKFTYTKNYGAAFGIGNNSIVIIISSVIILSIIAYILLVKKNKINNCFIFVLIFSGGISNLIDRVFRGYVIDYIDVNIFNFPKFNIADICITFGILYIIVDLLLNVNNKDVNE